MLLNLHVKNLALIEEADVYFSEGLNILTGETGAGKSILIGSINVALGAKTGKDYLRKNADYGLVELVFSVEDEKQRGQLKKLGLTIDEDYQVILTRKLTQGKSTSKINGETVPLHVIKDAAEILLDIHGQHEHQSLLYKKKHLEIIDEFCGNAISELKMSIAENYGMYRELKNKCNELIIEDDKRTRELSFLQFEIQEIEDADLKIGEDEDLETVYRKMLNGKKIVDKATEVFRLTGNEDISSAGEMIGAALRELGSIHGLDDCLGTLYGQLTEIDDLLSGFNRDLTSYVEEVTFSDEEFSQLEERLNKINGLKAKYGKTIESILQYQAEKRERLEQLENYESYRESLKQQFRKAETRLIELSVSLREKRKKFAEKLKNNLLHALKDLNFDGVQFDIQFSELETCTSNGMDEAEFLISTNPGEGLKPLSKVASGGELSRIMLGIKTVLADKDAVDTLIFDEIDTGISGRTAQKVSEKLSVISKAHQVICITHLPQIASMADSHFAIEKKVQNKETITQIRKLKEEEMVEELARLIGGAKITPTVMQSAKEMKELALGTK